MITPKFYLGPRITSLTKCNLLGRINLKENMSSVLDIQSLICVNLLTLV